MLCNFNVAPHLEVLCFEGNQNSEWNDMWWTQAHLDLEAPQGSTEAHLHPDDVQWLLLYDITLLYGFPYIIPAGFCHNDELMLQWIQM